MAGALIVLYPNGSVTAQRWPSLRRGPEGPRFTRRLLVECLKPGDASQTERAAPAANRVTLPRSPHMSVRPTQVTLCRRQTDYGGRSLAVSVALPICRFTAHLETSRFRTSLAPCGREAVSRSFFFPRLSLRSIRCGQSRVALQSQIPGALLNR
jgi:hypothetical protein